MPVNLTVKNIPAELHEDLKASAVRHRRSLNGEVIALLEEKLRPRRRTPKETLAAVQAVRDKMAAVWLTNKTIDRAKREGRR